MKVAIFDIDGTLADNAHRIIHYNEQNKEQFHLESINDQPISETVTLARHYHKRPGYKVIIITGRPNNYRSITMQWLKKQFIHYADLYMNTTHKPDEVFKEGVLKELQNKGYEVVIAFEDRQKVVDMWRDNGILCMQCDYGNF